MSTIDIVIFLVLCFAVPGGILALRLYGYIKDRLTARKPPVVETVLPRPTTVHPFWVKQLINGKVNRSVAQIDPTAKPKGPKDDLGRPLTVKRKLEGIAARREELEELAIPPEKHIYDGLPGYKTDRSTDLEIRTHKGSIISPAAKYEDKKNNGASDV